MATSLTLRSTKGAPLTHNEVDANFTALRDTADAAASAVAGIGGKANASALGVTDSATNMGTFTGTIIPDSQTAKQVMQVVETAIEGPEFLHRQLEPSGRMWADLDGGEPNVYIANDRFKGGAAYSGNNNRITGFASPSWGSSPYAEWMYRDSEFIWMANHGLVALTGMSKSSDAVGQVSPATIGIAGHIVLDAPGIPGWAVYGDLILSDATANGHILEMAAKNTSTANPTSRPHGASQVGSIVGILAAGGGDNVYGGTSTNPSDCVMLIYRNANTWNTGFMFREDGLTLDGNGIGTMIAGAKGHQFRWDAPDNAPGAAIFSTVDSSANFMAMVFEDNRVDIKNVTGGITAAFVHEAGTNCHVQLKDGLDFASVSAQGTNADIRIEPSGTGSIQLSTPHFVLSGQTVTGRMFIKDSTGTTRQIAILS